MYQVTINRQSTELFNDFGKAMDYAKSVQAGYVFVVAPYGGGIWGLHNGQICLNTGKA